MWRSIPESVGRFQFRASGFERVTIDDIIAANGPRLPAVGDAPTHFELGLVILTDHPLTAREWAFYDTAIAFMSAPEIRFVDEQFSEDMFLPERLAWDQDRRLDGAHLPYLNFHMSTDFRGTIEFVSLER